MTEHQPPVHPTEHQPPVRPTEHQPPVHSMTERISASKPSENAALNTRRISSRSSIRSVSPTRPRVPGSESTVCRLRFEPSPLTFSKPQGSRNPDKKCRDSQTLHENHLKRSFRPLRNNSPISPPTNTAAIFTIVPIPIISFPLPSLPFNVGASAAIIAEDRAFWRTLAAVPLGARILRCRHAHGGAFRQILQVC